MAATGTYAMNDKSRQAGKTVEEFGEKAGEQVEKLTAQAEDAARAVLERGREAGENVQKVAGNFKSAVDSSVKDQPMATLAMAAVVGFVLGALWKS